jgi:hypothetical protein
MMFDGFSWTIVIDKNKMKCLQTTYPSLQGMHRQHETNSYLIVALPTTKTTQTHDYIIFTKG